MKKEALAPFYKQSVEKATGKLFRANGLKSCDFIIIKSNGSAQRNVKNEIAVSEHAEELHSAICIGLFRFSGDHPFYYIKASLNRSLPTSAAAKRCLYGSPMFSKLGTNQPIV